jgi:lipopolysaccharide transport system ATP-binding protein
MPQAAERAVADGGSDVAIRVGSLGKRFYIGARRAQRYRTFREALVEAVTTPLRRAASLLRGHATGAAELHEEMWALKDLSFEVARGEVVGVIGKNGAGKTTLLKVISRITEPTEGWAEIHGRVGSLLEVGTGFHPELTGRENVFLNGAILGMRRSEIEQKYDEIVEFSEVGRFIETPVKHYSSGMYVRLAFAVAAHLEPEILLVDEVLSVGDARFQRKCLGKMGEVADGGRTILFVSHNMAAVGRLCTRVIWLDEGTVRMSGSPRDVIAAYLASDTSVEGERVFDEGFSQRGVNEFKLDAIRTRSTAGVVSSQLAVDEPFTVELEYRATERLRQARVGFLVLTADGTIVFDAYGSDDPRYTDPLEPGDYLSRCTIPPNLLSPGRYFLTFNADIPGQRILATFQNVAAIDIVDTGAVGAETAKHRLGFIRPSLEWESVSREPATRQ